MRLYITIVIIACLMLPGCSIRRSSSYQEQNSDNVHYTADNVAHGIAAENIEDLEFEEEASHLAAPAENAYIDLVEEPTQEYEEQTRQLQQARYGFKPIYFSFDQYTIGESQNDALQHNLKAISRATRKGKKGKTVVIEGHACRFAGSPEYNMQLSEKRAQSVKNYLVEHGIPENKLKVVGRGHSMCIVPSGNKEQQAPNRRVEFHVLQQ